MPTPTYTPLANITLGSSAASVTFSSISQVYRDLVLVCQIFGAGSYPIITFNSDTSNTYQNVQMHGNGSDPNSQVFTFTGLGVSQSIGGSATEPFLFTNNIMDYSATDKHKTVLTRSNRAGSGVTALVGRWPSTSAVNTVKIDGNFVNFTSGSTFALYGIASA